MSPQKKTTLPSWGLHFATQPPVIPRPQAKLPFDNFRMANVEASASHDAPSHLQDLVQGLKAGLRNEIKNLFPQNAVLKSAAAPSHLLNIVKSLEAEISGLRAENQNLKYQNATLRSGILDTGPRFTCFNALPSELRL